MSRRPQMPQRIKHEQDTGLFYKRLGSIRALPVRGPRTAAEWIAAHPDWRPLAPQAVSQLWVDADARMTNLCGVPRAKL